MFTRNLRDDFRVVKEKKEKMKKKIADTYKPGEGERAEKNEKVKVHACVIHTLKKKKVAKKKIFTF